ncbi:MAG: hypothetical protein QMC81_11770 [Thermoanaerobacterales bacterium]|nr:hypothetical protein [Thermoanaerobacterales bacterium]
MRIALLFGAWMILLCLAGCGHTAGVPWTPPPAPEEAEGSLTHPSSGPVTGASLFAEWTAFNRRDLDELRRLAAITDDTRRKEEAYKQWRELWTVYLAWKERGGEVLEPAGIRVYGPVAAGWMNEILAAMWKRDVFVGGGDLTHVLSVREPSLPGGSRPHKGSLWYELVGLNAPGCWSVMGEDDAERQVSDREAVGRVRDMLDRSTYPFGRGLFDGAEIHLVPGRMLYQDDDPLTDIAKGYARIIAHPPYGERGSVYSPEATLWAPRIVAAWPDGLWGLPHELGHAWFFRQHFNLRGIKDVYTTWADFRRPAVPATLREKPDKTLDDDEILSGTDSEAAWGENPAEALAEDFANMFFPGVMNEENRWHHAWPDIFAPGPENSAIRERLREFFLLLPLDFDVYRSLVLDPLPHLIDPEETLRVTGHAPAGAKVVIFLGDKAINETVAGPDGRFALDVDPKLLPVNAATAVVVAMETGEKRTTGKGIWLYQGR